MSHDAGAVRPAQRLSTPQTLHLMRLEVENATKHGYPISCMMFGLDGFFASELMLHRKVLMPLIFRELKAVAFERQVRGLGVWTEGFQLAVFPHVEPAELLEMAEDLRERVHAVKHASVPEEESVAVSIGLAHNLHKDETTFASIVRDAEAGMQASHVGGGDRISQVRDVESQLDEIKEDIEKQLAEIDRIQQRVFGDRLTEEQAWGANLVKKVVKTFQDDPAEGAEIARVQKAVVHLLKHELEEYRAGSSATEMLEAQKQIENLERRISKLTTSLKRTEEELRRLASMKDVDMGVASIYRTVQGLSADDHNAEAKGEMLKNIFEANLALRAEMAAKT